MANIENRRRARKLARTALPVCAALLLCAVIAAVILLPKACSGRQKDNGGDLEPSGTQTASVTEPAVTEPVETLTSRPSSEPDGQTELASPVPEQTLEDRSLLYFVINADSQSGTLNGSCAASFVNNTEGAMYGAYFSTKGLKVTRASARGAAVRFENGEDGVLLPFVRELNPGESIELYFEFSGRLQYSGGFTLPAPAYDTAFDTVCCLTADRAYTFSEGTASLTMNGTERVYVLQAQKVRSVSAVPA